MKNLILIIFLLFFIKYHIRGILTVEIHRCTPSKTSAPSLLLKNDLFCAYDKNVRPVNNKDKKINVLLQLIPKIMEFQSRSSTFTLHFWLKMKWTDDHLKWIPDQFEKVNKLHISSDELWTPDIMIVNSEERFELPSTTCTVKNTGNVTCVMAIKSSVSCSSDFTFWPYDEQRCKIRSGSSAYYSHEVDFNYLDPGIPMDDYIENHDWFMTRQQARKIVLYTLMFNYTELRFEFDLKRHSRMSHAVSITPAIILMMFTMTILWLDSKSMERIALAGVNFICHILCIYILHWMIPLNGISVPHILIFYRDSLVLASFAFIMTIVFRKLQETTATAPKWISTIVSILKDYPFFRFLVINDQEPKNSSGEEMEDNLESIQSINSDSNKEQIWSGFTNFIEWISLFSISITYFILLITLIPK